jgi:hypothetical protein
VRIALRLYKVAISFSDDAETPFQFFLTTLVAEPGSGLWFLRANADQVFRLIHYLSR